MWCARSPFSCLLYRTQELVDALDGIVTNVFVDEKGVGGLLIFGLTVKSQEGLFSPLSPSFLLLSPNDRLSG